MYIWTRLSLVLLCAVYAAAQNDRERYQSQPFNRKKTIEAKFERALWRHTTWSASPIFGLSETGYDNNTLSQQDNLRQANYSSSPYVGMETIWRPSGKFAVENDARIAYKWFNENDELNGIEFAGDSKWHGMFRRAHASLAYSFRDSILRPNSEIDDRVDNRDEAITGDLVFQLSARLFVEMNLRHNEFRFQSSDPVLNRLNQSGERYAITTLWQRSQRFWPLLELSYEDRNFKDTVQPYTLTSETAALGFRNEVSERFHIDLKAGPVSFAYDYPQNAELNHDASSIKVTGYANLKLTRRLSSDLSLSQTPIASVFEGFNHYISSRVAFGMSYQFSKHFALGPTFEIGQNDYRTPVRTDIARRKDDILLVGLQSQIPLKRPYQLGLTIGWHQRDSNIDDLDDEGLRVFLNMSYSR